MGRVRLFQQQFPHWMSAREPDRQRTLLVVVSLHLDVLDDVSEQMRPAWQQLCRNAVDVTVVYMQVVICGIVMQKCNDMLLWDVELCGEESGASVKQVAEEWQV